MKYFAAVAVPQSYRADIEIVHCAWRGIGLYSSPRAAEKPRPPFVQKLIDRFQAQSAKGAKS